MDEHQKPSEATASQSPVVGFRNHSGRVMVTNCPYETFVRLLMDGHTVQGTERGDESGQVFLTPARYVTEWWREPRA